MPIENPQLSDTAYEVCMLDLSTKNYHASWHMLAWVAMNHTKKILTPAKLTNAEGTDVAKTNLLSVLGSTRPW